MPKELHEITKFTAGTITVPDVKDISEDAASYSLNIDSVTASGKLQGVPADTVLQLDGRYGSAANATVDMDVGSIISFNGQNDVIYYEADTNKIHNIVDLYPNRLTSNCVEADTSNDRFIDDDSRFIEDGINLTTGGNTPNKLTVVGFDEGDNNGTFLISSITDGYLQTDGHNLITEGSGDDITVSTLSQTDMGAIVSRDDEVTMQVHNKEVHIGAGKNSKDVPKWVGYVDHKQFGTAQTAIPQIEDAELKKPGTFPPIYKIIRVGGVNFGIQYGGSRIYKFTDTAFDSASYTQFVSTQGLCLRSAGTDIFVYDDNTAFGTLYKIDVSEWGTEDEISQESTIDGWGTSGTSLGSGFDISDIHDDNTVVWFHAYKSGNIVHGDDWLYNATTPTANGSLTPANRTPRLQQGGSNGMPEQNIVAVLYKQCLVSGSTWSGVGVVLHLTHIGDFHINTSLSRVSTFVNGLSMISVEPTYPAKGAYSITAGGTDDAQIHEIITDGSGAGTDPTFNATTDYGGTDHMGGFFQDGTKFFAAFRTDTSGVIDTEIIAMNDAVQETMLHSGGSAHFKPLDFRERSDNDVDPIEADGLCMTYEAAADVLYMCENGSAGGYISLNYNGTTTFYDIGYLARPDLRVLFADSGAGDFKDDETYFWKFAYVYDEYQESPLSSHVSYTPADDKNVQLTIDLYNLSGLSTRISHLAVYRAQNDDDAGQTSPETFYRLVKKIKLDTSFALISNGWGSASYRSHVLLDQLNNLGASYEARTLMPETLETSIVNYALSTQINSQHIVGKCYKTEVSDPMNYLFKSKVNNFDQFDWTTDFLRLPMTPTALASFNGRIYAFDENNTYRINPHGFYIEDVFNGVGCFGPKSVLVTEYGMCYCDKNNIYLHDGKSPKPIGMQILTGDSSYSWHNINTDMTPSVMFDSKRKSFMIFFRSSDGSSIRMAWSYNIIFNRWDMLKVGTADPKGFLHGKNGEMFISYSNVLTKFLGSASTTLDAWEWQSKYMTMGEDTSKKKFYDVKVIGDATAPTISYGVNGDTTPTTSLSSGKVASGDKKSKSLQIKLLQVAGATHKVDSVGVLYRRLPKTSGNI